MHAVDILHIIGICQGFLQPVGKVLFLNTQFIYVIQHGETKMVLTQKDHPYQLAFMMLEDTLYYNP